MKELLTRHEVAETLDISERQWDRVRKAEGFTEVHVTNGRKGLRFLSREVAEYIEARKVKHKALTK